MCEYRTNADYRGLDYQGLQYNLRVVDFFR